MVAQQPAGNEDPGTGGKVLVVPRLGQQGHHEDSLVVDWVGTLGGRQRLRQHVRCWETDRGSHQSSGIEWLLAEGGPPGEKGTGSDHHQQKAK